MSGVLAEGWQVEPLGELVEFLDSNRVPIKEADREKRRGQYPYYGANGLVDWINGYTFDEPLVLLAEDGGFFGSKDHPIAYKIEGKTWVNNHAHVLRPRSKLIDLDYLHWFLSFLDVTPFLSGSTRAKLTKSDASRIAVILPKSLDMQKKIAEVITRASNLERKREQANQFTNKIIQAVFLKMFGDPERNEKDWQTQPLHEMMEISKETLTPRLEHQNMYHVGSDNIESGSGALINVGTIQEDGIHSINFRFNPAQILYSKIRPNLRKVAAPGFSGLCSADIYPLTPRYGTNRDFLCYLLRSDAFTKYATSISMSRASIPKINREELEDYPAICPPASAQQSFSDVVQAVERLKKNQLESSRETDKLFHSLMHKAFKGELPSVP